MASEQQRSNGVDRTPRPSAASIGAYAASLLDDEQPAGGEEPEETPPEEPEEADETPAAEPEDDEAPVETDEEPEPAAARQAGRDDDEGEAFESLEDLLAAGGLEQDAAQALPVRVKVDGEERTVPLGDLIASHQIREAAEHRLEKMKEQRAELDVELATKREQADATLHQAAALLERVETQIADDSKDVDWAKLREDDPAEYSAKKAEIAERREQLETWKREAIETFQAAGQQQRKLSEEQAADHRRREMAALEEKIPEWKDPEKAKQGRARLWSYLREQGFPDEIIKQIGDHKMIVIARKAQLYDDSRKTSAKKRSAPKPARQLRPGAQNGRARPAKKSEVDLFYPGG